MHRATALHAGIAMCVSLSLLTDLSPLRSYLIQDIVNRANSVKKPAVKPKPRLPTIHRSAGAVQAPVAGARVTSDAAFPAFTKTSYPVRKVPHWGAMRSSDEWNRTYVQMTARDFVPLPAYDIERLLVPFAELKNPRNDAEITRKLTYSTKHFAAYDLDAEEYTAVHPGIDIKLALGTPLGALAGGRVHAVAMGKNLGLHVILEHRHPTDGVFYSIYGHLGTVTVHTGDAVRPGQTIGTVGMTGHTSGPHVHLQVDRGRGEKIHKAYLPKSLPDPEEAEKWTVHPILFIERYRNGI